MKTAAERIKKFRLLNPWSRPAEYAKRRCTDTNHKSYKFYGGRGIKFLLEKPQIIALWFRDNGYDLKQPSLDREDPDGHYELSNCRFIELVDNVHRKRARGMAFATTENQKDKDWE